LDGDNVVDRSTKMDWYQGPTLMYLLENIHIGSDINRDDFRFPVQYVIRPQSREWPDYRGYGGRVASGVVNVGDTLTVLPSGFTSKVKSIDIYGDLMDQACAPLSVSISLEDDIDISRGDMLVKSGNGQPPRIDQNLEVMICWFNEKKLVPGSKYVLKHTTSEVKCMVKEVHYRVNISDLEKDYSNLEVCMNDIARVSIRTTKPLFFDSYSVNRTTGSLILIDEATNETVAAGMIV
jgi:sulfate adenylyltransferase subunit 1